MLSGINYFTVSDWTKMHACMCNVREESISNNSSQVPQKSSFIASQTVTMTFPLLDTSNFIKVGITVNYCGSL